MPAGVDEAATPPAFLASVGLIATTACNLGCSYCPLVRGAGRRMPWKTARAALDLALRSPHPSPKVIFHGGEPLLAGELVRRAVRHVRDSCRPGQLPRVSLTTNGTMLDGEWLSFLARNRVETDVSFDGLAPAQDRRRVGSFAALDGLLDRVREREPHFFAESFGVRLTVTSANFRDLAGSVGYFLDKGLRRIVVSPAITAQPDWRTADLAVLREQFAAIREKVLAASAEGWSVPLVGFGPPPAVSPTQMLRAPLCALSSGRGVVVGADGAVWACMAFASVLGRDASDRWQACSRDLRLGSVWDAALPDRLTSLPERLARLPLPASKQACFSVYGRCRDCREVLRCRVCLAAVAHQPGEGDRGRIPSFQCAFERAGGAEAERFQRAVSRSTTASG